MAEIPALLSPFITFLFCGFSFGLSWQVTRVFHLAWGATFLLSAYTAYWMFAGMGGSILYVLPAVMIVGGAVNYVIERFLYNGIRQRGGRQQDLVIAGLGILICVQGIASVWFGPQLRLIPENKNPIDFGSFTYALPVLVAVAVGFAVWLATRFDRKSSRFFILPVAVGENSLLCDVLGVSSEVVRRRFMGLSGVFCGLTGSLVVIQSGVQPEQGFRFVLLASLSMFLGGVSRPIGWVVGALIVAGLQTSALYFLPAQLVDLIIFAGVLCVLLIKRDGVVSSTRRQDANL
jgi:branched-chain amino acid transport system permease protein